MSYYHVKSQQVQITHQFVLLQIYTAAGFAKLVDCLGYELNDPGLHSRQGQEIFLFSETSSRIMWPTQLLFNKQENSAARAWD